MKNFYNNANRELSDDEMLALIECNKILKKAFSREIHSIEIRPNNDNKSDIYGILFSFNISDIGRYKK